MANPKTSSDNHPNEIHNNPCHRVQHQIRSKKDQLYIWKSKLETLLNDENSDIGDIGNLRHVVRDLYESISSLKAEQRRLGCLNGGSSGISQDNQTIISTSSVRRKDARALEIIDYDPCATTRKEK